MTSESIQKGGPLKSIKPFLIGFATNLVFLGIILLSAGRLNYWPAWEYAGISVLMNVATRMVLRDEPDLARERAKPGTDAKPWDKKLLGLGLLLTIALLVIAGLDTGRFLWSPHVPWSWSLVGVIISLVGMAIALLAMKENRFFSAVIRVQSDRGHTVCRTGPYSVVRHPGNAGMIIGTLGFPFMFMSVWCAIPALLSVVLLVIRTHLEDLALANELEGYRDYQNSTHYRLMPGIW